MIDVVTESGMVLSLAEPALASGGEGSIYRITGYKNKLAKIYHKKEIAARKEDKIKVMVANRGNIAKSNPDLLKYTSWPHAALYDKSSNFIGFGMDLLDAGVELTDVYVYPPENVNANISIKDKIDIALSLCDLITELHDTGNEFGDFNPNNIRVFYDKKIGFVDTDNYHIHTTSKTFKCAACEPTYVAPEISRVMHGYTYETCPSTTFTKESDYWALAVHVFRLLFNGAHPYTGMPHVVGQSSLPALKPLEMRVERGETVFFKPVPGMKTPEWTPEISAFPDYLIRMFERAFVDGHRNPKARPDSKEWSIVLKRYRSELVGCSKRIHYYHKDVHSCPYCAADARANYTPQPSGQTPQTTANVVPNVVQTVTGAITPNVPSGPAGNGLGQQRSSSNVQPLNFNSQDEKNYNTMNIITVILSIILQLVLMNYVTPLIYDEVLDLAWAKSFGIWGGAIAGALGTVIYNSSFSAYPSGGRTNLSDYVFALVWSVLGTVIFTIAWGLVVALLLGLFSALKIIFTVVLVCSILYGLLECL